MRKQRSVRRLTGLLTVVAAGAIVLAACGSNSPNSAGSNTNSNKTTTSTSAPVIKGGTVTWAEPPSGAPNYILPFMSLQYFSVSNISEFQYMMYRPLYWFGQGNTPALNNKLSVANAPVYNTGAKTITITLKPWKWSNGESVDAKDVMFWMNMLKAQATGWAAWAPGSTNFPQNVTDVTVTNPHTLVFHLNGTYNDYWFTYNELSQVTPLPLAWDKTSASAPSGSGGCANASYSSIKTSINAKGTLTDISATAKKCAAVYTFLANKQNAGAEATYASNPLWKVVDGPWSLQTFDATTGRLSFVPNPSYSGSPKPIISQFVELPFTTDTAEYSQLQSGSVDVGYIPAQDVPKFSGKAFVNGSPVAGTNPSSLTGYTLSPLYSWGINYFVLNFTNSQDGAGPILKQLYVRQAMQTLMNQDLWIKIYWSGYAVPTYGPVPVLPPNSFASPGETNNPYPYSPSHAKQLLSSHGWHVVPNGTSTCVKPGTGSTDCGAGIPAGAKMSFNYLWATGQASLEAQLKSMKTSWAQAGININLQGKQFADVIGAATPCKPGAACQWDIANWGGGWSYAPDFYPTGEEIFETGAGSNSGNYSDPINDANIKATQTETGLPPMVKYENYLARQLPVIWQPNPAYSLTEIKSGICGVTPQQPTLNLVPEYWYRCKG